MTSADNAGMTGYDIIGDIHGYAGKLEALLKCLDYQEVGGVWVIRNEQRSLSATSSTAGLNNAAR